eukprot:5604959-Amphidinium_carterae.2
MIGYGSSHRTADQRLVNLQQRRSRHDVGCWRDEQRAAPQPVSHGCLRGSDSALKGSICPTSPTSERGAGNLKGSCG